MVATINADTTNGVIITSDTSGEIELQANGVTKAKITANGLQDANGASLRGGSFRNLIINGDMQIAQRGTSSTGITSSGYYTVDRWNTTIALGTWTQSQDSDVPSGQGFTNSLKMSCTTANASPASSNHVLINQKWEGQNLQQLKKGTTNAESITVSFWVKSNKTGTYILEADDRDNTRAISQAYTISSANTWEKKTLTFDGDTTGAFDNDNGNSFNLTWWLGVGSDFSSGTLATSWTSRTNANRVVGQVNLADSTSNYINITGLQLEVGSGASDFEFLPYDVQLARCQRYAYKLGGEISNYYADSAGGYWDANYIGFGKIRFPVPMRTAPSATFTAGGGINVWRGNTTYTGFSWNITVSGNPTTRDCFIVGNKTSHGVTVDAGAMIKFEDTAANCLFSAEL